MSMRTSQLVEFMEGITRALNGAAATLAKAASKVAAAPAHPELAKLYWKLDREAEQRFRLAITNFARSEQSDPERIKP